MKQRLHILFLIALLAWQGMISQTYPVTLVPQVMPPAPIYFSSYADASSSSGPLKLQIVLNDLSQTGREIKLKTYFEGNGIAFESKDVIIGAPSLFVEGGIPLLLTNLELAPYFTLQNISGISPAAYGQVIPEGSYQFCFEVYDAPTGARISQKTCATTYIFQNEPPLLIAPNNQTDISEQNPLNLLFQWTPRHINVSNVQYELSIVEIWDQTMNPQAAFLGSPPVFQTTTTNTSYLYGPADPLLLPNKRYAWRVQAKAINGAEEIGLFKNKGFSEIYWFNYTAPCDAPENVRHEIKGVQNINILWDDFATDVPEFKVRYREKGNQNEWFFSRTNGNWVTLWDLRAGTTYEYQVYKKCLISESEYSRIQSFTTPNEDDQTSLVDCGISPDMDIENMEPLEQLFPGNVFKAGDFPVKVTETNGSNGRFSGKGYVTFPYFNSIKVAVNFTNVFINNENQLAEGTVITTYDSKWGNILDVDEVIDVVEDIADVFTGGDNTEIPRLDYDIDANDISIADGQIIITNPNGTQDTFDYDEGDTYTITDASGDEFTVDKDGTITQTGTGDTSPSLTTDNTDGIQSGTHNGTIEDPYVDTITNDAITVTFRTHKDEEGKTQFALDLVNNDYEKATYPKINTSEGSTYYPAHKAIIQGESDVFYADITINDTKINIDSLIIKTAKNKAIKHERLANTNTYKITISGANPYRTEECVVTYLDPTDKKYKIAASFFVHHLKKHTETPVQVVTVNGGNNLPNLEADLNDIFGKAGGKFKVKPNAINITIAQKDWDDNDNGVIDYDGSGILADYPTELKNIYKAFKKQYPYYDSQQYFVLVLGDEFVVSKPLSGFMPKTRQWGFLFEKHMGSGLEKKDSALKVAAHELGHGVFSLEHPFGENIDKAEQANTWLMDYGNGTELGYPNWATMSDPSLKLMLFQDDSDGEYSADQYLIGNAVVPKVFSQTQYKATINTTSKNQSCISFVSIANKLISIPVDAKDITFYHTGALYGFTVVENGKWERYIGTWGTKSKNTVFKGYAKSTDIKIVWQKRVFKDYFSKNLGDKVTVHLGKLKRSDNSCGIDLYKKEGYVNTVDKGKKQWNSGGRDKTLIKSSLIGGLKPYLTNVSSPKVCNLCPDGNKFYKTYSYLVKSEEDTQALIGIAKLICSEDEDKIDYDILVAQIDKDFSDQIDKVFWGSDKALFVKAREVFWNKDGALSIYLTAIEKIKKNINTYNKKLGSSATKEEFYSALYYLSDEFIKSLDYNQRYELLKFIFKNNAYISEGFFSNGKDDVSLIKKILNSLSFDELDLLVNEIIGSKNIFENANRDVLFEIAYALELKTLKNLGIHYKLKVLEILLKDKLTNMFGNNEDAIVTKIVSSVRDSQAKIFFDELQSSKNYSIDKAPLLYNIKTKLSNLLNDNKSYTKFFLELNRLSNAINKSKDGKLDIKKTITWDVKQRDFALVAFVDNRNNYNYVYDKKTHTVSIKNCLEYEYHINQKTDNYYKVCIKPGYLLEEGTSPFSLVGVLILNDVSPLASDCRDGIGKSELCGKMLVVPAIFIEYLDESIKTKRWENLGWNTFNVAVTIGTLGEGALAIKAIQGAKGSAKIGIAFKKWYPLLDLTYTSTNLVMGATGSGSYKCQYLTDPDEIKKCKEKWANWNKIGLALTAKSGLDLTEGVIKAAVKLKNLSGKDIKEFIKAIRLKKHNKVATEDDIIKTIDELEKLIKKNDDLKRRYEQVLAASTIHVPSFKTKFLNKLDGYSDNISSFKNWVNQLGDSHASLLKKLDDLGDDIVKFGTDFDFNNSSLVAKFIDDPYLVDAWTVLKEFPKISTKGGNLEILSKVSGRFEYNNKSSFDGLYDLFNGSGTSKQNLIDGLKKVDEIFDSSLPLKFSGVKKGDVKVIQTINGKSDEVARYVDGILQKKKTLDDGDVVGKYNGDDILQKGDEVGFRKINNAGGISKVFFKNVDDFARTFDKAGEVNATIRNQAFDLYKQGKWRELETLFNNNNLNGSWPPANGGFNIVDDVPIKTGQKFDRYSGNFGIDTNGNPILGGSFTSPLNKGTPYKFGQRALNKSKGEYDFYYEIEVLQDLPFKAQNADVIPWFGQIGGAKQSMWKMPMDEITGYPKTWNKLAEEGYIKITIKGSPSGNFSNLTGTIIKN
ncbi:glycohydrolase toxin TNT-related protein [Aquimarina sp. I32.4]|uniref:glycohydrolase toxin TNT-related protein n=1 Tax=Aquimarina sp. I32.4 TaxID=2053903 RepID=UPI001E31545E|nr:glycohydrolase toxin TNT-related protein [Aquimarina sp. I32.4]